MRSVLAAMLCAASLGCGDSGDDGGGTPDAAPDPDTPIQPATGLVLDFRQLPVVATVAGQDVSSMLSVVRGGDFEGLYRDATGAWVTAAAGELRLDHDDAGDLLGVLLEPEATNYMLYSSDFTQWTPRANTTVTPAAAVAPDGSNTATNLVMPQGGGTGLTAPDATVPAGTEVVFSMWARANGDPDFRLELGGVGGGINQDIALTDDWAQYTLTGFVDAGGSVGLVINNINEGTLDCFIWGVQLEEGPVPTSYIPTAGAEQTRGADVVTLTDTGWASASAGTFVASFRVGTVPARGDVQIVSLGNSLGGAFSSNLSRFVAGDASVTSSDQVPWSVGDVRVVVGSYGGGTVMFHEQGASPTAVISDSSPLAADLTLGGGFSGHVRYVEYFDESTVESDTGPLFSRAQ